MGENSYVHYDLQTVYNFVHMFHPCARTKDGGCNAAEVITEATGTRYVVGSVCKMECLESGDAPCKDEDVLCCNEKTRETGETDCNSCEEIRTRHEQLSLFSPTQRAPFDQSEKL